MFKDKGLIIGMVITILLIVGGVFLMSRDTGNSPQEDKKISTDILVSEGANITSGISDDNYLPASTSAQVTLVEFGDYECPACTIYHTLVKQLLFDLSGQVNYVFRNYPLNYHSNSLISTYAVEAAGLQGKYWQMHDKVYETSDEWADSSDANSIFVVYANDLGLDAEKFRVDMDSDIVKNKVQADINDGDLVKLTATPTFFVNGVKIEKLNGNYSDFKKIISDQLYK